MNILHVSTFDISGGAALAAYRLHRAMAQRTDCRSSMLVREKASRDPSVLTAWPTRTIPGRVQRRFERWRVRRDRNRYAGALAKAEMFSEVRGLKHGCGAQAADFDVVQLHWTSNFLSYGRFFAQIPATIPIVWRLADMNPFTGGCHYDGGCGRFAAACGACPKLESRREDDLSRTIWRRKKAALDQLADDRLHIVTLNQWMADQVGRSSLIGRFARSVIPNGVDLEEFAPLPATAARAALGIPEGRRVIAFVAEDANNTRKGFRQLLEALQYFSGREDLFLLIVGQTDRLPPLDFPCLKAGTVQSTIFLRQIYNAADVFVIPSLEDNQPNTVLEAMACGTPVVGFWAGGIPEMVESGRTGWLAAPGDTRDLAGALERLLGHEPERLAMAVAARRRAVEAFSRAAQVEKYIQLYSRLLSRTSMAGVRPADPAADRTESAELLCTL
jgi:glycosyltransferase involved in cell wall biosynthesis